MKTSIKFDVKKTVQYWLEGAEYDLGVADAMFEKGKYPYALFMGHPESATKDYKSSCSVYGIPFRSSLSG
ncbi:MAG: HEPN domain-containing protein [Desulfobacterales bacterium]